LFRRLLLVRSIHAVAAVPAFMPSGQRYASLRRPVNGIPGKTRVKNDFDIPANRHWAGRVELAQSRLKAGAREAAGVDAFATANRPRWRLRTPQEQVAGLYSSRIPLRKVVFCP
jgi:hypothetical protein